MRKYSKDLYYKEALHFATKLVTLLDTNPYRPTYGSFDREYWHYKTSDFPCSMHQSLVLPLALFYLMDFPGNMLYRQTRVEEWIVAALHCARKSAHKDGSGDDYYPYERALGAVTYSLFTSTEAYLRLGLNDEKLVRFFCKRASWIARHHETGNLANHHATSVVSLYNTYLITKETTYRDFAQEKLRHTLSLQSEEGWFQEYEGCDPGYNTITIDFLAKYYQKSGDDSILPYLEKSVKFAQYFMHPDGSYSGLYGSRDNCQFFPHGFEILAPHFAEASWMCDQFLCGMQNGKQGRWDDDRVCNHHLDNYLLAYLDYTEKGVAPITPQKNFQKYFSEAGLLISQWNDYYCVLSLKKGGSFRLFKGENCIHTEAGYIGQTVKNQIIVSHLLDKKNIEVNVDTAKIKGNFNRANYHYSSSLKLIILRSVLLVFGRFQLTSRWMRRILQKFLIVGKVKIPIMYERTFRWNDGLHIVDNIYRTAPIKLKTLSIGTDFTSIYTAIGDVYQEACFQPWEDLSYKVNEFNTEGKIKVERRFS